MSTVEVSLSRRILASLESDEDGVVRVASLSENKR
jgi:hypothetical protein